MAKLPADGWKPHRQDSLEDQLVDLLEIARREGMYDAHDYLLRTMIENRRKAQLLRDLTRISPEEARRRVRPDSSGI